MPKDKLTFDSTLFIVITILLVFGTVMVYSASSFKAHEATGDSHYYLKSHFLKVLAAFALMWIVAKISYRFWIRIAPALLLLCFLALIFLLISPTVEPIRGSRRWIILGSMQMQPSDFARVALILFLSRTLVQSEFKNSESTKDFSKTLAVIGFIVVPILMQPDVGTAGLITFIALTMVFLAGEKLRHLALLGLTAVPFFLLFLKHNEYQKNRILQYLASLRGEEVAWQVQQSMVALGNGQVFGVGLGSGRQKYHFLPDPFTDFIFAIVGEELGIIGATVILALFMVLIWRGFKISMQAPEPHARLLSVGIVLNVALYAITNAGVVTNLLPTTGIPLPFVSYGGSALMANLFGIGLLLNVSAHVRQNRKLQPAANEFTRSLGRGRYGRSR